MMDEWGKCALLEVCEYSVDNLKRLLVKYSHEEATDQVIEGKLHTTFFKDYFNELQVKTIVAEGHYIDRNYLDDHGRYYLKCFRHIKKNTTRLHFFGQDFTEDDLLLLLAGPIQEERLKELDDVYLGFIVVKPLVRTIVGRTCLKTYDESNGDRFYPIKRKYKVNLFGLELSIDSLAFQEQDSVVAACATSSLWSAFHATGKLFQHPIPSPSTITELATKMAPLDKRAFPNEGLTPEQMAHAIGSIGLDPDIVHTSDFSLLKATVCAYLDAKIPPILIGQLIDAYDPNDPDVLGWHAVTVTGYRVDSNLKVGSNLPLKSDRMLKLYAHDDQVGPFSKMEFELNPLQYFDPDLGEMVSNNVLGTHWVNKDPSPYKKLVKFYPAIALLPLYPKIRIPIEKVMEPLSAFHEFLEELKQNGDIPIQEDIEWKLSLATINQLKTEYLHDPAKKEDIKRLLVKPCPRFLWRAVAFEEDAALFELLFDATDIEQTGFYFDSISHDESTLEIVSNLYRNGVIKAEKWPEAQKILEHLAHRSAP